SRQVLGVRALLAARARPHGLEARAGAEIQARHLDGAAHELRARDEVLAPRGCELAPGALELALCARIARQVVALIGGKRLARIERPVRRRRPSGAGREQDEERRQDPRHGSRISVSRSNGHLRLISSRTADTLRSDASTSARSAWRSALAARALPLTCSASARMRSTRLRLSRTSPRIAFACAMARSVPSTRPFDP